MTVILPFGRALVRQTFSRPNHLLTRFASVNPLQRASCGDSDLPNSSPSCRNDPYRQGVITAIRAYATAVARKPAGRPKAHTGRAAAKKAPATAKPKAKPRATKKKPARKSTAKPKASKRVTKKPPSKTALNKARIVKAKDLKTKALLSEPKQLPASAWSVYFSEEHKTGISNIAEGAAKTKEIAQSYRSLAAEERERLNHTANQNKTKNTAAYQKWLSQYTPIEIKEANNARKQMNNEKKAKEGKKKSPIRLIKDDRLVKQQRNAYSFFTVERFASGDFKHMTLAEASRLAGREWKALSADEKKPYEDQAQADLSRYHEEVRTVYGKEPATSRASRAS